MLGLSYEEENAHQRLLSPALISNGFCRIVFLRNVCPGFYCQIRAGQTRRTEQCARPPTMWRWSRQGPGFFAVTRQPAVCAIGGLVARYSRSRGAVRKKREDSIGGFSGSLNREGYSPNFGEGDKRCDDFITKPSLSVDAQDCNTGLLKLGIRLSYPILPEGCL